MFRYGMPREEIPESDACSRNLCDATRFLIWMSWRPRASFRSASFALSQEQLCSPAGRCPCARWRQCLETLRPVTGVTSQVIRLGMPTTALCGDCLVRVVGSGLKLCVQWQVRSPR